MPLPQNPRRALAWLIAVTLILRVGWAAVLETGADEAYNFLYSVHPDWSYFDHPPMTMWVGSTGLWLCGGVIHPLTLRLGYLILFAASTWLMYALTARWHGAWAGFYAALALNLSAYHTAAAGAFALPDGPFLFFSLLTLWALAEALVRQPGAIVPWLWVGLAWAGALLSKYHAVFLPAGALLYMLVSPRCRSLLLSPGPYLAVAIGFVGFTPVLYWNATHDWASFVFQGGRALGWQLRPAGPLLLALGTMALLFPWLWLVMMQTLAWRLRAFRRLADVDRLFVCVAIVPLAFFLAVSCGRQVVMHWPMLGFMPLFCLLGVRWAEYAESEPAIARRRVAIMASVTLAIALAVVVQARFGLFTVPTKDPCYEFSGWNSVADELKSRGLIGQPDTFLFTACWENRSQPEQWVGKDGFLISLDDHPSEPKVFERFFERIDLVATFPMMRGNNPFRNVRVFRCHNQIEAFPFAYPSTSGRLRATASPSPQREKFCVLK
jgi:4-amino-4-deoxy-L-arabinose transferase-like glycosyltransferase